MRQPDGEEEGMAEVEYDTGEEKPCQYSLSRVRFMIVCDEGDEPKETHKEGCETEQCP